MIHTVLGFCVDSIFALPFQHLFPLIISKCALACSIFTSCFFNDVVEGFTSIVVLNMTHYKAFVFPICLNCLWNAFRDFMSGVQVQPVQFKTHDGSVLRNTAVELLKESNVTGIFFLNILYVSHILWKECHIIPTNLLLSRYRLFCFFLQLPNKNWAWNTLRLIVFV